MNLVIVESPTKAKKLSSFLGKEFLVKASVGHVRDLPKSNLGIDLEKNYEPVYEVSEEKKKVVAELRKLASGAKTVYLATDPDREGEAIAWHIQELLKAKKKDHPFLRATFHEITKPAVLAAISKPAKLNMSLVDAQQARRVVDRLVGYKVSPVLWKKIRRGLSAGRVQSVALRLIVEREKEIEAFKPVEYWEVDVALNVTKEKSSFRIAQLAENKEKMPPEGILVVRVTEVDGKKYDPHAEKDVTPIVELLPKAIYTVASVEKKERNRSSLPPFTTSTLQQAAANRLGFTSKQTMALAQQLYEEGFITYHRTDSVSLSSQAVSMAREFIQQEYGAAYLPEGGRAFSAKTKNAQEAHEAIRATHVNTRSIMGHKGASRLTPQHDRLYDLIWRRFVASQMNAAVYDQTTIQVDATPQQGKHKQIRLRTSGSVLKFDGWMKLFPNMGDVLLPAVNPQQQLYFTDLNSAQKFTQPPARYNDASLVKTLEEKGIGRPSTYASIISVIVERGYVERQEKRFIPTSVGVAVCEFLTKYFEKIMDYDFTAEMEEDLDRISRGEKEWRKVVGEFFSPLEKIIDKVTDKADRVQIPVEETDEICPKCGQTEKGKVVIRTGRFGKFKSCSRFPECDYTEALVETVDGMKCPLCQQGDVIARNTRWGKMFYGCGRYPDCDWASWSKPEPGYTLSKEQWEIMKKEREERKAKRAATRAAKFGKTDTKVPAKKVSTKKKSTKKGAARRKKTS